jgi:hypothetical protein
MIASLNNQKIGPTNMNQVLTASTSYKSLEFKTTAKQVLLNKELQV